MIIRDAVARFFFIVRIACSRIGAQRSSSITATLSNVDCVCEPGKGQRPRWPTQAALRCCTRKSTGEARFSRLPEPLRFADSFIMVHRQKHSASPILQDIRLIDALRDVLNP